jgi:hypothetical protein
VGAHGGTPSHHLGSQNYQQKYTENKTHVVAADQKKIAKTNQKHAETA